MQVPDINSKLVGALLRFRSERIAAMADVNEGNVSSSWRDPSSPRLLKIPLVERWGPKEGNARLPNDGYVFSGVYGVPPVLLTHCNEL